MADRVLVAEEIAEAGVDLLRHKGFEVEELISADREKLLERVTDAEALIVRSGTQVDAEMLEAGGRLKVVGRAGTGLDNIDVETATRRGVMVVNAPQSNTLSAAEHSMALMLALVRNIPWAHESMRDGQWARSKFTGTELVDKVLGVAGLGRIGTLVAQRAMAFGMRVIGYDPYVSEDRARQMGVTLVGIDELCEQADIITLHMPRTPETMGMISAERLARMKPTARIINAARGGLIDEVALAEALSAGQIAGAAIDVYSKEPPPADNPLRSAPNVLLTPHLGASTAEAQDKAGKTIAEQVALALAGEFVPFAVNVAAGREVSDALRPFVPLAEVLGSLFVHLAGGSVPVLDVSYHGQLAEHDTRLLTLAVEKGFFSSISEEPVSYVNAPLIAEDKGITVRESSSTAGSDFVNLVRVEGERDGRTVSVAGTVTGARESARIVEINGHEIDLPPSRLMLVVQNDDRPGVIGRVGTILGEGTINIANMAVGRDVGGVHALMGLNIDSPIPADVLERLRNADGIISVDSIVIDTAPESV